MQYIFLNTSNYVIKLFELAKRRFGGDHSVVEAAERVLKLVS